MSSINGDELSEKVKAKVPELPIIMVSAYLTPRNRQEILDFRVDAFLDKPVSRENLTEYVSKFFPEPLK